MKHIPWQEKRASSFGAHILHRVLCSSGCFAAVEPDGQVSGAIWVGASTASGVIQDIKVLVNGTEDGFICEQIPLQDAENADFHFTSHMDQPDTHPLADLARVDLYIYVYI